MIKFIQKVKIWNVAVLVAILIAVAIIPFLVSSMVKGIERSKANMEKARAECWEMGDGGRDEAIHYEDGGLEVVRICFGEAKTILEVSAQDMKDANQRYEEEEQAKKLAQKKVEKVAPETKKKAQVKAKPATTKKSSSRPAPKKVGATPYQQELIEYTWTETSCRGDEQFITMIEGESGWDPKAVEILNDGSDGHGLGACQVDSRYWEKIHSDPRFRNDAQYQIEVCCTLWKKGVRFYGADRNTEMISRFRWPEKNA